MLKSVRITIAILIASSYSMIAQPIQELTYTDLALERELSQIDSMIISHPSKKDSLIDVKEQIFKILRIDDPNNKSIGGHIPSFGIVNSSSYTITTIMSPRPNDPIDNWSRFNFSSYKSRIFRCPPGGAIFVIINIGTPNEYKARISCFNRYKVVFNENIQKFSMLLL